MTEQMVFELMMSSKSEEEWSSNCVTVKGAHSGAYPEFWFAIVIQSGLMRAVAESW